MPSLERIQRGKDRRATILNLIKSGIDTNKAIREQTGLRPKHVSTILGEFVFAGQLKRSKIESPDYSIGRNSYRYRLSGVQ